MEANLIHQTFTYIDTLLLATTQGSYQQAGEYPVTGPHAQDSRSFKEQAAEQITREYNEARNEEGYRKGRENAVHQYTEHALTETKKQHHQDPNSLI